MEKSNEKGGGLTAFEKAQKLKKDYNKEVLEVNLSQKEIQKAADDRYLIKRKEREENVFDQRKAIKELIGYGSKEEKNFYHENKGEIFAQSEEELNNIKREELELRKDTTQAKEEKVEKEKIEKRIEERLGYLKDLWVRIGEQEGFSLDTVIEFTKEEIKNPKYYIPTYYKNGNNIWFSTSEGIKIMKKLNETYVKEVEPLKEKADEAKDKYADKLESKDKNYGIVFGLKSAKKNYDNLNEEYKKEQEENYNKNYDQYDKLRGIMSTIESFVEESRKNALLGDGRQSIILPSGTSENTIIDILIENSGHPFSDSLDSFKKIIEKDFSYHVDRLKNIEERNNKKIDNLNKKLESKDN